MNFQIFLQNFTVSLNFDDFQPKTPGNSEELRGTPRNSEELRGTPGGQFVDARRANSEELRGIPRRHVICILKIPRQLLDAQTSNILLHFNHNIFPS